MQARRWIPVALGACLLAQIETAQAGDDLSQARRLFEEAVAASERADWEVAAKKYEASLSHKWAPTTLYSLGVALRESNRPLRSLRFFRAFLAEPNDDPDAAIYREAARRAVAELSRTVGHVVLDVTPPAARVTIAGVACSPGTEACFVAPGAHVIEARATGYQPMRSRVVVAAGQRVTLSLTLEEEPQPIWPIVTFGGGVALFATGVTLAVLGLKGPPQDHDVALSVTGDVFIGAGLGAAAIGAVFWALLPATPETSDVAIRPWSSGDQVGMELRF